MIKNTTPEEQQLIDEQVWEDMCEEFLEGLGEIIDEDSQKKLESEKYYGHTCKKCGEYFEYTEANQRDGTFKCYGCRNF